MDTKLLEKYSKLYEYANLSDLEISAAIIEGKVDSKNNEVELNKSIKKILDKIIVSKIKHTNNIKLRNDFIMENIYLYKFILKKYPHFLDVFNQNELESFTFESLVESINKYNFDRNSSFSTYSIMIIYKNLQRYIENNYKIIREPVVFQNKKNKINKYIDNYEKSVGNKPNIEHIAKYFNMNENQIIQYLNDYTKYSLNTVVNEETETEFGDLIPDFNNDGDKIFDKIALDINTNRILISLKELLTPKQFEVFISITGLEHNKTLSMTEIADKLGITHQAVNCIYKGALNKIKRNSNIIYEILSDDYKVKYTKKLRITNSKCNLYDSFSLVPNEHINMILTTLSEREIRMLRKKYGDDFRQCIDSETLDLSVNRNISIILRKIRSILNSQNLNNLENISKSTYSNLFENPIYCKFSESMTIQNALMATVFVLENHSIKELSSIFNVREGEARRVVLEAMYLLNININSGDTELILKDKCKLKIKNDFQK